MNRLWLLGAVFFSCNALAHTGTQLPVEYINDPVGLSADGETVIGDRRCQSNGCPEDGNTTSPDNGSDYVWTAAEGALPINYNPGPALNLASNQTATSWARSISATGDYIAGQYFIATGYPDPNPTYYYYYSDALSFRWSQQSGFEPLGVLAGYSRTHVQAISADGQAIVGNAGLDNYWNSTAAAQAFRWTPDAGMVSLGQPPYVIRSMATLVSADGSVVAGHVRLANNVNRTFRWTQATGMISIGGLPDSTTGAVDPVAMTPDGSVIVGNAAVGPPPLPTYVTYEHRAYRWDSVNGMVDLGSLNNSDAYVTAVSADGNVIVGSSGGSAFRWTPAEGMVSLGNLPGASNTFAAAVSADGSVIVGRVDLPGCTGWFTPCDIFVWTEATGMLNLRTLLTEHGYEVRAWQFGLAYGMQGRDVLLSSDGKTLLVTGTEADCNSPYGSNCALNRSYIIHLDRVAVEIDFDIFTAANQVTPGAAGYVSVGVLGSSSATGDTSNFDATQVDPASLKLGTGEAPNVLNPLVVDTNADGNTDVAFGFLTADTGIACEDTEVTLVGATYAGESFSASDNITTPECVDDGCHP